MFSGLHINVLACVRQKAKGLVVQLVKICILGQMIFKCLRFITFSFSFSKL